MSGSIVRRLTAAIILAAILCLAAPAAAAPAGSFLSPVVSGPGLFDQLLAWLGSLWPGSAPHGQRPAQKSQGPGGSPTAPPPPETDGHGMVDPNGQA